MISSNIRIRWNGQTHWIPSYQIKQISYQDLVKQIKMAFKDDSLLLYDLWVEEGQCVIHDDQTLHQAMEHSRLDINLVPKFFEPHSNRVPVIKPIVLRWTTEDSCKRKHWPSDYNEPYLKKDSGIPMNTTVKNLSNQVIYRSSTGPSSSLYPSSIQLAPIKSLVSLAPISPNPPSNQFICDQVITPGQICGQTFRRSYDLSRHQAIHLKNRPLSTCRQCGKKFTRMDALRRHERIQGHHTPLKQQTWSPYPIHSRQARV